MKRTAQRRNIRLSQVIVLALLFFPLLYAPLINADDSHKGKQTIQVACDPWPPWIEGEEGGPVTGGIFVDITRQLLVNIGIKADFTVMPFTRVLNSIKNGSADMALMVSKTGERSRYGLYSSRILSSPFYFYALHPAPLGQWHSWQQLRPYKIGATRDFNYGPEFIDAMERENISLYWSSTEKASLALLLKSRLDLVVLNQHTARSLTDKMPGGHKLVQISPLLYNPDFSLFIARSSAFRHHLHQINAQIRAMQDNGEIMAILKKYPL
ncbi:ABC transporter substrate-binding protein [Thalassomonas sp. RHCl1]|uniref:substrate-binding periplasmic protein n=1 Tax=Thalassomonas sp. RHCl1 TaxID=2995320 RepID=UPI00248D1760|nr:ABC transporter substrate-binding protein [Thalassomonas sp. RHCl1]